MASWPVSLPQSPLLEGYSEEPGDNVVRSPMDAGPPKTRRRFTARIDTLSVSYVLTAAQLATFEGFWQTTIADGALAFTMPHPRKGTTITVQPTGPYSLARDADTLDWRVSFQIYVIP